MRSYRLVEIISVYTCIHCVTPLYCQSKKKSKPKKKPAAKTKVSAENVALRECVASLQDNETALVEKVGRCMHVRAFIM